MTLNRALNKHLSSIAQRLLHFLKLGVLAGLWFQHYSRESASTERLQNKEIKKMTTGGVEECRQIQKWVWQWGSGGGLLAKRRQREAYSLLLTLLNNRRLWALRGDVKCLPAGVNVKFMNANEIDSYHIRGWEESQADTLDFEGNADRWQVGDMLLLSGRGLNADFASESAQIGLWEFKEEFFCCLHCCQLQMQREGGRLCVSSSPRKLCNQ